jgi:hypothetical protein
VDPPELELGDWEPHKRADFTGRQWPTIQLLNIFGEAFYSGQIPKHCWRGTGPDYENEQIILTIYPDDTEFRSAVAAVMPQGSYRINVSDIRFHAQRHFSDDAGPPKCVRLGRL